MISCVLGKSSHRGGLNHFACSIRGDSEPPIFYLSLVTYTLYSANSKLALATYHINNIEKKIAINRFVTQAFSRAIPRLAPGYPVPLRRPCTHAPVEPFLHSSNNTLIAWEPDKSATSCVICSGTCAWPSSCTDRFQQPWSEFSQSKLERC